MRGKDIIRSNRERAGIRSNKELAERIGIPLSTFNYRISHPGTWIQYELRELVKVTGMPDEDLVLLIRKG